jgi:DDE_Tnp_1-associated
VNAFKFCIIKSSNIPNGIPSHDTFARVFSQINPEEFNKSFLSWVKGICKATAGEIIAFDGKQSRNSGDEKNGRGIINTVSAWATSTRLVLGQKKVEGKSNEIVKGKTSVETRYFISSLDNRE